MRKLFSYLFLILLCLAAYGCEGLAAEDGRNILIRDDPASFAQAVRDVLRDETLRRRLGAEGRRTVERRYSWDAIGDSLRNLYSSLLRSQTGAAVAPASARVQ